MKALSDPNRKCHLLAYLPIHNNSVSNILPNYPLKPQIPYFLLDQIEVLRPAVQYCDCLNYDHNQEFPVFLYNSGHLNQ